MVHGSRRAVLTLNEMFLHLGWLYANYMIIYFLWNTWLLEVCKHCLMASGSRTRLCICCLIKVIFWQILVVLTKNWCLLVLIVYLYSVVVEQVFSTDDTFCSLWFGTESSILFNVHVPWYMRLICFRIQSPSVYYFYHFSFSIHICFLIILLLQGELWLWGCLFHCWCWSSMSTIPTYDHWAYLVLFYPTLTVSSLIWWLLIWSMCLLSTKCWFCRESRNWMDWKRRPRLVELVS